ncbi:hypothetical protein Acsp03_31920 [Actinomadura sp. NBRC 104412]|nr:hypothetical protein Acsp03_31920 [Actinomadura sp. NBRC 104412]
MQHNPATRAHLPAKAPEDPPMVHLMPVFLSISPAVRHTHGETRSSNPLAPAHIATQRYCHNTRKIFGLPLGSVSPAFPPNNLRTRSPTQELHFYTWVTMAAVAIISRLYSAVGRYRHAGRPSFGRWVAMRAVRGPLRGIE